MFRVYYLTEDDMNAKTRDFNDAESMGEFIIDLFSRSARVIVTRIEQIQE